MKAPLAASALATLAVVAACATVLPPETGEYAAGQRLYREHCGSCHRLRNPNEQTREKWARAVKKYGDRAHLAPEDRPAVLDYLQARANALAATGKIDEAKAELSKAEALIAAVPADARQGNNLAKPVYETGQLKARARVASAQGSHGEAAALLSQAVAAEDKLAYNEPSDIIFPTRHLLGAELLTSGKAAEAEAVFNDDLKRHPNNGWAYFGLSEALAAQKKDVQAAEARKHFGNAWEKADFQLASMKF